MSQGNGFLCLDSELHAFSPYRTISLFIPLSALSVFPVSDNPIQCDCNLAWLAFSHGLGKKVKGSCDYDTWTEISEFLQFQSLKDCGNCPYQCLGAQFTSLCVTGTVSQSNVSDCRPKELCCELEIPKVTTITPPMASTIPFVRTYGFSCNNQALHSWTIRIL